MFHHAIKPGTLVQAVHVESVAAQGENCMNTKVNNDVSIEMYYKINVLNFDNKREISFYHGPLFKFNMCIISCIIQKILD